VGFVSEFSSYPISVQIYFSSVFRFVSDLFQAGFVQGLVRTGLGSYQDLVRIRIWFVSGYAFRHVISAALFSRLQALRFSSYDPPPLDCR
jgi:hypothetical protein